MLLLIWFLLVAVMITAYVVLDGFDLGVGVLHLFIARTDLRPRNLRGRCDSPRRVALDHLGNVLPQQLVGNIALPSRRQRPT